MAPQRKEAWEKHFEVKASNVLYVDDEIVVFSDRHPKATSHLLIVPRHEHIVGEEALEPKHVPLLKRMERTARELSPESETPLVLGFHQKYSRSVPHLHLHSMVLPYVPPRNRFRYGEAPQCLTSVYMGFARLEDVYERLASS